MAASTEVVRKFNKKVDEYSAVNAEVEKLKPVRDGLKAEITHLEAYLAELPRKAAARLDYLESRAATLTTEIENHTKQLNVLRGTYSSQEQDLKTAQTKLTSQLTKLKSQVSENEQENISLISERLRLIKEISDLNTFKNQLSDDYQAARETAERKLSEAQQELQSRQAEASRLATTRADLEVFYKRIKRYYREAGLEWFEINDLE